MHFTVSPRFCTPIHYSDSVTESLTITFVQFEKMNTRNSGNFAHSLHGAIIIIMMMIIIIITTTIIIKEERKERTTPKQSHGYQQEPPLHF